MKPEAAATPHISIPSDQFFTNALASLVLDEHAKSLPDLTHINIILPNAQAAHQMRSSLSKKANKALLSGFIGNLGQWLQLNTLLPDRTNHVINQASRELILLEALKQHPNLFEEENYWQLCDSLLELFDELTLSQHPWLDAHFDEWVSQLAAAYQTGEDNQHLSKEARIIHTLWQAWQQQLSELNIADEKTALKARLLSSLNQQPVNTPLELQYFYIVGIEQMSPTEQAWCKKLTQITNVFYISQGTPPDLPVTENNSGNLNSQLLNIIYSQEDSFFNRCTNAFVNNIQDNNKLFLTNIKTFDAQSAEQETQAIDLKVRQAILRGDNNIGIITENRKLARRLRALLDRADIKIQDTAGWALATTSSATILERWLECIEQDFAFDEPGLELHSARQSGLLIHRAQQLQGAVDHVGVIRDSHPSCHPNTRMTSSR